MIKQVSSAASSARQSPAPKKEQLEKPKPKQSEFANLDAFLGSPSSSPAISHQAKPTASQQLQGADFFFGSSTTTTNSSPSNTNNTFDVNTQQQAQSQKHNDFKSSILSLYNNMPAANPPPQQYNGNFHNQMAGLNLGNHQPPVQQQQQYNNNNSNMWGSFATATPIQPQQPQQIQQPQGSQFFSSNNTTPKKPERE